jgi:hypothetical protein
MVEAEYERKTLREVTSGALTIADMETALLWLKIADAHLSRQAELLARAAKALEPFHLIGAKMASGWVSGHTMDGTEKVEQFWAIPTVSQFATASSTLDAIRDELGETK